MSATVAILLLWIGFAGTHLVLSSLRLRPRIVARIGLQPFLGIYSLLVLGFFIPLVWTYFAHKHAGQWLWLLPRGPVLRWTMYVGMGVACVLLVAGVTKPSPAAVVPGDPRPKGVYGITRHPVFMANALFGLMHLLANSSSADIVFFGGFVVFAFVGGWHQDRRKLAMDVPGFRAFYAATPFVPFTGPATVQGIRELSPVVVGLGVVLAVVVRYFHASWFGG